MAHITLSIPDKLYDEMKRHPEIKWSEAARRGIQDRLLAVKGVIKGSEWLNTLPESIRNGINELKKFSTEDWKKWHKKVKEREWKRMKSLMQVS